MVRRGTLALFLALSLIAPSAHAEEKGESYAWQTLLVDAGALGIGVAGLSRGDRVMMGVGAGGYLLGAPLVHFGHEDPGAAAKSFGLRVLAPPACGAIGFGAGVGLGFVLTGGDRGAGGAIVEMLLGGAGLVLGVIGGYVTAVVVDAEALAREPVVKPAVDVTDHGMTAGVRGTF